MKKNTVAVFAGILLCIFLFLLSSCSSSCATPDPTPYIPREYESAFLCGGSFSLGDAREDVSGEDSSESVPRILSASYQVRQKGRFYSIRYEEGRSPSAEPLSVGLSSPVVSPSGLALREAPDLLKTAWRLSQPSVRSIPSEKREPVLVSFSSAEGLFGYLPNQGLPCYVYSLSGKTVFSLSGSYEGTRSLGICTVSSEDPGTLFYILIDL